MIGSQTETPDSVDLSLFRMPLLRNETPTYNRLVGRVHTLLWRPFNMRRT